MTTNSRPPRRKLTRITPAQKAEGAEGPLSKHWRTYFLQELAATSNVSASAAKAGVSTSRAYKARREHPEFAAQWNGALREGYEHLEMEVLACLRGNLPDRKIDVANAIRLLSAHRQSVAQLRALDEAEDEEAVLASLTAKLDAMRSRQIALHALLADDAPPDDQDR